MDSFEYNWKTPNESAKSSQREPEQVVSAASIYFASEEEAIGVEQLFAEPEYGDIVDTLLDFNTCACSLPESYIKEFSASEPVVTNSDRDAVQRGLSEEDKTREKFLDELSNGYNENHCSISCEDYLLDIELEEETPTLDVTRDVSCIGNMNLEKKLADSEQRNCGVHVLKLSDASTSSDHDALDEYEDMSTDKLLEVFRNMFGHQTSVADKQWLESHMIFGLENQEMSDKNYSFPKSSLDSSENQGVKVPPACQNLLTVSTAFASIFNFRTKPRVQHVKRREHIQWNSFKCLSSAAGEIQLNFPDKWDSKELAKENVKCDGTKLGISEQNLKCKPSRGGFGWRYYHRGAKVSSQGLGKRNFQVGCIQIPPGLPIEERLIRREGHLSKDCRANRAYNSNIRSAEAQDDPSGTLSDQSSDNSSEDDWTIGSETRGTNQDRKHNKYWSTTEVLKLVEGVSKYGVGRWSDIKRMFFQSSVHRSPADLKDKWRNLLRASCRRLQSRRGVDAKKKHGVSRIPHEVLNRVRELAVIYPYSRKHRTRISPTASLASSSNVESDSQLSMNEQNTLNLTY
uniref:Putative ovule protein n=1 Tax=Solanum chacoense TaxID=4108 RepID=A0A0V0IKT8_SOLCH